MLKHVVDKQTRTRMTANIKGKNTKPEVIIHSLLHLHGFRIHGEIHLSDNINTLAGWLKPESKYIFNSTFKV